MERASAEEFLLPIGEAIPFDLVWGKRYGITKETPFEEVIVDDLKGLTIHFKDPQPFTYFNIGIVFLFEKEIMIISFLNSTFTRFFESIVLVGVNNIETFRIPDPQFFFQDQKLSGARIDANMGFVEFKPAIFGGPLVYHQEMVVSTWIGVEPPSRIPLEIPFKILTGRR